MPGKRRRRSTNGTPRKRSRNNSSFASAPVYLGPVRTSLSRGQRQVITVVCQQIIPFTPTGGNLIYAFGNNPSATNAWASLAAVYDEFRCLMFEIRYVPQNRYNWALTTTSFWPLVGVVIDRDNATFLNAYTGTSLSVDGFDSAQLKMLSDPWTFSARAADYDAGQITWANTANPVANYWIKTYGTGCVPATQPPGSLHIMYRVQFRGRGQ